jgi:hypothetical protein
MDFERQWREGVGRVTAAFEALDPKQKGDLSALITRLMEQKRTMQALVEQVEAAVHCADCKGECCVAGKYHFTGVDLLAYLVTQAPLFAPLFGNGLCCYLAQERCLMPAPYRPFNCITFNCERIERLLPEPEVERFYQLERELRESYARIRALFPDSAMGHALLQE